MRKSKIVFSTVIIASMAVASMKADASEQNRNAPSDKMYSLEYEPAQIGRYGIFSPVGEDARLITKVQHPTSPQARRIPIGPIVRGGIRKSKGPLHKAWNATKSGSKKAWIGTKSGSKKGLSATKSGVGKAWALTKNKISSGWRKAKSAPKTVWKNKGKYAKGAVKEVAKTAGVNEAIDRAGGAARWTGKKATSGKNWVAKKSCWVRPDC